MFWVKKYKKNEPIGQQKILLLTDFEFYKPNSIILLVCCNRHTNTILYLI